MAPAEIETITAAAVRSAMADSVLLFSKEWGQRPDVVLYEPWDCTGQRLRLCERGNTIEGRDDQLTLRNQLGQGTVDCHQAVLEGDQADMQHPHEHQTRCDS